MFPGFVNIYRDENEFIHLFFFSGIDDSGNDIYRNIDLSRIELGKQEIKDIINNAQLSQKTARIDLYPVGEARTCPSQRIDLCEDCYQEFINFLET